MIREFQSLILSQASKLQYRVADLAPSDERSLFNSSKTLVIWSGASDATIWQDAAVNWAFRALHDALHLQTGLGFSPEVEMHLGRIQANMYTGLLADLVYIETAGQAEHYLKTGRFVEDQVEFTLKKLKNSSKVF